MNGVENNLRGIGETARESGLSVSALRFYDGAGVLVPAWVDPDTGYRRYSVAQVREAALLAALRRAGLPLADLRMVLAGWSGADGALVDDLLAAHLRRLESALTGARLEFSAVRAMIARKETPMNAPTLPAGPVSLAAPAGALSAALDAVRFAVSRDPGLPVLGGLLFDAGPHGLTLVATDRYRLAVAPVAGATVPAPVRALVPAALADAVRALLPRDGEAVLTLGGGRAEARAAGRTVAGECLEHDFPDHRRLMEVPGSRRLTAGAGALRSGMADHPFHSAEHEAVLTLLEAGPGDRLRVVPAPAVPSAAGLVAVNRDFLAETLNALGGGDLVLEYAGPTAPLTWSPAGGDGRSVLLMPVRLNEPQPA